MMVPKFRAYIKNADDLDYNDIPHKGHFVYGNLIKGNPNDDVDAIVGNLIEINDEYVNVEWWQPIEKGSAEQSIGIKDINGNKIYEGDIIKVSDETGSSFVSVVKYFDYDDYPAFDLDPHYLPTDWYLSILKDNVTEIKVVGNAHTNPELLEAQHE